MVRYLFSFYPTSFNYMERERQKVLFCETYSGDGFTAVVYHDEEGLAIHFKAFNWPGMVGNLQEKLEIISLGICLVGVKKVLSMHDWCFCDAIATDSFDAFMWWTWEVLGSEMSNVYFRSHTSDRNVRRHEFKAELSLSMDSICSICNVDSWSVLPLL